MSFQGIGTMDNQQLANMVDQIMGSQDDLICDDALVLIARITAIGLSETQSRHQYPALWQHLGFCPDCADTYTLSAELHALSAESAPPVEIPPRPRTTQLPLLTRVQNVVKQTFPGFSVQTAVAVRSDSPQRSVTSTFSLGEIEIELAITPNKSNRQQYDLLGTVFSENHALENALEGATALLQQNETIVQEKAINELGDFVLSNLDTQQTYDLHLIIVDQHYWVHQLTLS